MWTIFLIKLNKSDAKKHWKSVKYNTFLKIVKLKIENQRKLQTLELFWTSKCLEKKKIK